MKESSQPEQSGDAENISQMRLWVIAVTAVAILVAGVEKTKARVAAVILSLISILPEVVFAT